MIGSFSVLYPLWCRAWLHVAAHQRRLVDLLAQIKADSSVKFVETGPLAQTLERQLAIADRGEMDDFTLSSLYGCLAALEVRQRTVRPSHLVYQYPEAHVNGARYVLLSPGRQSVRRAYPQARHFKLNSEFGLDGALGLGCRWVKLQHEDVLDWRPLSALDRLRSPTPHPQAALRIGIAPCADAASQCWRLDDHDLRAPDGRAPLQCLGSGNAAAQWQTVETVLQAAYDEGVQVLLFPELVLDAATLQAVRDWLATHNLRAPRLRLVVAGSRHHPEADGWRNRCTVLDLAGEVLWEQDKRTPFVIDDAKTLQTLKVGCTAARAFEPTRPGYAVVLRESLLGRLLTPICLDYIDDALWAELGADIFLVPAMSKGLSRFRDMAKNLGGLHGTASFVCNAETVGKDRLVGYLPVRGAPAATPVAGAELFTIDVDFVCSN